MRIRMRTSAYQSADHSSPARVYEAQAFPTTVGMELMWEILAGRVRNEEGGLSDHLGKGRIIVGDGRRPVSERQKRLAGDDTMWAEVRDADPVVSAGRATWQATFATDVANFHWRELGFTTVQGILICRVVADQDVKTPATTRTVRLTIELGADVTPPTRPLDEVALLALL